MIYICADEWCILIVAYKCVACRAVLWVRTSRPYIINVTREAKMNGRRSYVCHVISGESCMSQTWDLYALGECMCGEIARNLGDSYSSISLCNTTRRLSNFGAIQNLAGIITPSNTFDLVLLTSQEDALIMGCALVGDHTRAVGQCRDVAKAQPTLSASD